MSCSTRQSPVNLVFAKLVSFSPPVVCHWMIYLTIISVYGLRLYATFYQHFTTKWNDLESTLCSTAIETKTFLHTSVHRRYQLNKLPPTSPKMYTMMTVTSSVFVTFPGDEMESNRLLRHKAIFKNGKPSESSFRVSTLSWPHLPGFPDDGGSKNVLLCGPHCCVWKFRGVVMSWSVLMFLSNVSNDWATHQRCAAAVVYMPVVDVLSGSRRESPPLSGSKSLSKFHVELCWSK